MIAKAKQNSVRISSQKANLVCKLIRGKSIDMALRILDNTEQKAAKFLSKLVAGAAANAVNNHGMSGKELYVFHAIANQGPTLKRQSFRAKHKTDIVRKRSTHFEVHVSDNLEEKALLNKKLLRPRAHQNKVFKQDTKDTTTIKTPITKTMKRKPIHVETQVIDNKGNKK